MTEILCLRLTQSDLQLQLFSSSFFLYSKSGRTDESCLPNFLHLLKMSLQRFCELCLYIQTSFTGSCSQKIALTITRTIYSYLHFIFTFSCMDILSQLLPNTTSKTSNIQKASNKYPISNKLLSNYRAITTQLFMYLYIYIPILYN